MSLSQATLAQDGATEAVPLPPRHQSGHRRVAFVLIIFFVIAGIAFSALHLLRAPATPEAIPQAQSGEESARARTPLSLPDPLPAQGTDASARLDSVEERTIELAQRVDGLIATMAELTTSVTALSDANAQLRSRLDALNQPQRPALRRPPPIKPTAPSKPNLPAIVSVDSWANQSSVAIRDGDGRLAFYREGDTVGVARIQRIDTRAGQVQFRLPDGSTATATVHD
ncbi:hypothetical protein GPA22_01045 [Aromatoleum toluvorans]|uniref:Type IV pilus biogenesis protein PilP n=1 Tax=Aromatoleum toluvorans TaxID=92002 RepID=A0ABX1PT63_9RHOO|nr:hypothetical protein [Aromatoleum toluvorans]NMG42323.1 hypothetical protein [Aromatoleum toluvorans]